MPVVLGSAVSWQQQTKATHRHQAMASLSLVAAQDGPIFGCDA